MNFSPSSALKFLLLPALALLASCGPDDGSRALARAREAVAAGRDKKARESFETCLDKNPANVEAAIGLALLLLRQGELPLAEERIEAAAALDGESVDVKLLRAQIAWHRKDDEKAASLYASLAQDPSLSPAIRSQAWTELGIVQMAGNEFDLARVSFLHAMRLDKFNAATQYHLGLLYRYAPFAYLNAARAAFEKFVYLSGESDARVQKVCQTVIPALKQDIAQETASIPGVGTRNSALCAQSLSRADKAWKKGSFKTALAEYRKAEAADPLSVPAALGLARALVKTDASKAAGKEALTHYRRACLLRPGAVAVFLEAGALAERVGQIVTAREIYSRALAVQPTSADALDGLVRVLRKAGQKKVASAYQAYRDALKEKP